MSSDLDTSFQPQNSFSDTDASPQPQNSNTIKMISPAKNNGYPRKRNNNTNIACHTYIYQTHGSTTNLHNYLKIHRINKLNYKNFLDEHNEQITRKVSGAKYPTINLIYSYMYLLKQRLSPTGNNTIESYLDLIYGPVLSEDTNEINNIDSSTDSSAEDSASSS
ncbi:12583_t:CDS:2, partial [Racocetra fulgida]